MARTKRHIGFGKWVGEEDGVRKAGPFTGSDAKQQAEAWVLEPSPQPKSGKSEFERNREYWEKANADLNLPIDAEMTRMRAALDPSRDEDEKNIIMRQIEPILKAGKQAGRRERMRFMLPAAAPAKAA
jgi:hypothetical protein